MNDSQSRFGKCIRDLRAKVGLTQEQLAEKANLSLKHLGEIERGRGNPSLSSIENLARALGVPVSALFEHDHLHQRQPLSIAEVKIEIQRLIERASDDQCRLLHRLLTVLFT